MNEVPKQLNKSDPADPVGAVWGGVCTCVGRNQISGMMEPLRKKWRWGAINRFFWNTLNFWEKIPPQGRGKHSARLYAAQKFGALPHAP